MGASWPGNAPLMLIGGVAMHAPLDYVATSRQFFLSLQFLYRHAEWIETKHVHDWDF